MKRKGSLSTFALLLLLLEKSDCFCNDNPRRASTTRVLFTPPWSNEDRRGYVVPSPTVGFPLASNSRCVPLRSSQGMEEESIPSQSLRRPLEIRTTTTTTRSNFSDSPPPGQITTTIHQRAIWTTVVKEAWRRVKAVSQVDKQAIAKLGISFGLTYSIISNINGSVSLSLAWYIASKKTGLSPLAPGQWKTLLAAYGTLYVFLCILRPFRIALALGATRKMDLFLQYLKDTLRCSRPTAIGVAFVSGLLLWVSLCALGVTLASTLA
eukprot:CAMPEP_0178871848 /NCGR_PEP_ID=MMETSP0747-20121128/7818_1 /TAXON_ID=913974 /ORGANISM="Nitzschia punctata, Strain CCMP561" /LENGTH=265 /DNA_ID=CAMNT_0020539041 /DNA_START=113 /DNA_END=907 /DNA_ORIENTATION=-